MPNQTRIKYILLFLILLPFILNILWSGTGPEWLYWVARFLIGLEELVAGILLVFFPMLLQRLLGVKADRRVAVLLILFGLYLLNLGIHDFAVLGRRWSIECVNIIECIK